MPSHEDQNLEPATAAAPGETGSSKSVRPEEVQTWADLVRYAYSRQGQRVSIKAMSKKLLENLEFSEDVQADVRAHTQSDELLRVPWQLLAAAIRADSDAAVINQVTRIVALAVKSHPVLTRPDTASPAPTPESPPAPESRELETEVRGWAAGDMLPPLAAFEQDGGAVDHAECIQAVEAAATLADEHIKARIDPDGTRPAKDTETFRSNLVNTLTLLFATTLRWPLEEVADVLYRTAWKPTSLDASDRPLLLLTDSPDPNVAALIVQLWAAKVDQAERRVDEAMADAARMNRHAGRLQQRVDELETEKVDLKTRIDSLEVTREELQAEIASRDKRIGETRAHASHDFETLRTRATQRAKRELDLLEQGLHALTRDEPKIHVTQDRLERAIEGLQRELRDLKGD